MSKTKAPKVHIPVNSDRFLAKIEEKGDLISYLYHLGNNDAETIVANVSDTELRLLIEEAEALRKVEERLNKAKEYLNELIEGSTYMQQFEENDNNLIKEDPKSVTKQNDNPYELDDELKHKIMREQKRRQIIDLNREICAAVFRNIK